jgi:two-component system sensor histidine kinase KdpD
VDDTKQSLAGREVKVEIPPDIPFVRVDPVLLHHCLINLLDNAGRYGDVGTPVIVRGRRLPDALLLSVIDQGPGLPPGSEERVFDTFIQIEGTDRAKHGTGLGLAIVKGFAEAMGLTVSASNAADPQGAVFTIRIPEQCILKDPAPEDMA